MRILLTRIRKVSALGALCTSLILLTACSSGSDNNVSTEGGLDAETQTPAVGSNEPGAEDVVGRWVSCSEVGGLRVEYEFAAATFINRIGGGSCAGFESADQVQEFAGSYSITGTTTADTGVTAFTMELSTQTLDGFSVFELVSETRFRLAYTGTPNQIVFSDDSSGEQERSLTLDFDRPFVKF